MSAVPVVLLVCAAVWSTIALDTVYVSPDNGHSCPSGSTCHPLSYYISRSETYFTSNTIIIFMNGEHQLDKQEPVMVVGADNLTLEGQGEWIAGPEETVMLSTAVINCTSGKGGFTFINSSSITIKGLTFLTCGTQSYTQCIFYSANDVGGCLTPYAAIFVMNVKRFQYQQNSIQDSTSGFGLLVYQCDEVKVSSSSFFISQCPDRCGVDGFMVRGNSGFLWSSFTNTVLLEILYSNFTEFSYDCKCGIAHIPAKYPCDCMHISLSPILVASENKQMLNAEFSHLMCFNNTAGDVASCINAVFRDGSTSLQITNSIFRQGTYNHSNIYICRARIFI